MNLQDKANQMLNDPSVDEIIFNKKEFELIRVLSVADIDFGWELIHKETKQRVIVDCNVLDLYNTESNWTFVKWDFFSELQKKGQCLEFHMENNLKRYKKALKGEF